MSTVAIVLVVVILIIAVVGAILYFKKSQPGTTFYIKVNNEKLTLESSERILEESKQISLKPTKEGMNTISNYINGLKSSLDLVESTRKEKPESVTAETEEQVGIANTMIPELTQLLQITRNALITGPQTTELSEEDKKEPAGAIMTLEIEGLRRPLPISKQELINMISQGKGELAKKTLRKESVDMNKKVLAALRAVQDSEKISKERQLLIKQFADLNSDIVNKFEVVEAFAQTGYSFL